jgi:hypothetical protein
MSASTFRTADRPLRPDEIVGLAYDYADALKAAEKAAERLWKHLPPSRQLAFDAADTDFSLTETKVRGLADAWQGELDGEPA